MSHSLVIHNYSPDMHLTWEEHWGHFDPSIINDGDFVALQALRARATPNYISAFVELWQINTTRQRFAEFDDLDGRALHFRLDLYFDPEELWERATAGKEKLPQELYAFLLLFQELVLMEKKMIIARNSDLLT